MIKNQLVRSPESRRMPTHEEAAALASRAAVAAHVSRDHAIIRALLDALERACSAANERTAGGLASFRAAVWDLYVTFERHLDMEEAQVAPILRAAGASGEARAVEMILEHNEQRRILLELVEDAERDALEVEALVAEALALVRAFRTDMASEDRSIFTVLSR